MTTLKDAMGATNITKEDLDGVIRVSKEYLEEFDKKPQADREKEFVRLMAADAAVRKLHDAFHETPKEKVFELIDLDEADLFRQVVSILGCFTMIGAHCGFMSEVKDEAKAN